MAYAILRKEDLNPQIFLMEIHAPAVAKKAEPGQFIILRIDEYGERVPFTIADFDREKGSVTIIPFVYAGGDVVTGAATVILAMGAGKTAALAIHDKLQNKEIDHD